VADGLRDIAVLLILSFGSLHCFSRVHIHSKAVNGDLQLVSHL